MNKHEAKALKKEEKMQRKYTKISEASKFKQWRNRRPFWGATFTVLAALMILYIPIHLYAIAFIPGSLVFVGFIFGGLLLITGIFAYIYPQFSTVFGVVTIFLSIISIMGALGGFIIGSVLGIIAGALCIAWNMEEVTMNKNQSPNKNEEQKQKRSKSKQSVDEKQAQTAQV